MIVSAKVQVSNLTPLTKPGHYGFNLYLTFDEKGSILVKGMRIVGGYISCPARPTGKKWYSVVELNEDMARLVYLEVVAKIARQGLSVTLKDFPQAFSTLLKDSDLKTWGIEL